MNPDGRDEGRRPTRARLLTESEAGNEAHRDEHEETDVVFDFTGLHRPDVCDLALILTARLQSAPEDRVWVRALPLSTWAVLRGLGVDHLFREYPGVEEVLN